MPPKKSKKPTKRRTYEDRREAGWRVAATKLMQAAQEARKAKAEAAVLDSKEPPMNDRTSAANKRKRPPPGSDDTEPDSIYSSLDEDSPRGIVGHQNLHERLPPMYNMPVPPVLPRTPPRSSPSHQSSSDNEASSPPRGFSPNFYKPLDETACPHPDTLEFRNEVPHDLTVDEAGFDHYKDAFEMPEKRFEYEYTVIRSCREGSPRKARRWS
ncbi:hypothetical protein IFR05_009076 [Cadophora sp. M221]|nr:hypothetical protein IFR05_009076 [Cadophora sp. M221]